jgi:5-formyltetrahydrofolate cyclo-ligase
MPKRSIRSQFLAERKSIPVEACTASSAAIQQRLLQSIWFRDAGCLALYNAMHNEVLTDMVCQRALSVGKTLVYPRVKGDDLEFVEVHDPSDLLPGAFGVLEPRGDNLVPITDLDLIVVPGVAFDQVGHRLGYGRGFYDRALAACRTNCVKIGFAYGFQMTKALPAVAHDVRLSILMTENETLEFTA